MNKAKLKTYAPQARKDFIAAVTARANLLGIAEQNGQLEITPGEKTGDLVLIAGQAWPAKVHDQGERLIRRMQKEGFAQTIEAIAYTWFNRFAALRFMEIHDYLGHGHRVLSSRAGGLPDILTHATELAGVLPGLKAQQIADMKLAGNQDGELYRLLLVAQCNGLSNAMPFLFERIDDESELLLPGNLERTDSVVAKLVEAIPEEDWNEVEVIGWLYQFYISEKKDEVIGKVVKSEDIPAATQLFTPNWIVQYLVQNSVGRLWLMANPTSSLKSQWPYYIEPAEQTPEVQAQLDALIKTRMDEDGGSLNPETITVLDPACGSGHILVEAYEILKGIYLERGYQARSIPRLILEKNLYGLDIDDRAAQLAGFALLMKARADDRRLLETPVRLNVLSLQESAGMDLDEFAGHLKPHGINRTVLGSLLDTFTHAKTFGSLIQIPKVLEDGLASLEDGMAKAIENGDVFARAAAQDLVPLVQQAKILAMKFDAAIENPPYCGSRYMTPILASLAKSTFKTGSGDLFAMFVLRSKDYLKPNGYLGVVCPFVWMFIATYEAFRRFLLTSGNLESMIRLEYNGFEPACVPVSAWVYGNHLTSNSTDFIDLSEFKGIENQDPKTLAAIENSDVPYRYLVNCSEFLCIPTASFAYFVSSEFRKIFSKDARLGDLVEFTGSQNITANNNRFLRQVWEINSQKIGQGKHWVMYAKGGGNKKWWGLLEDVIDWSQSARDFYRNNKTSNLLDERYWYRPGVTYSMLTSKQATFRILPVGAIYDKGGPSFHPVNDKDTYLLMSLCNSVIADRVFDILNPTMNLQVQDVKNLPLTKVDEDAVYALVDECVTLAKVDWDTLETSTDFQSLPLLRGHRDGIKAAFEVFEEETTLRKFRLNELDISNDRIWIEAFGLQSEVLTNAADMSLTGAGADREKDSQRLISYAIGCMMGRYSLDEPGLIYAHAGNAGFNATRYKTFPADADGIIPITDELWFDDDAANRIREFLLAVWPAETLDENMTWLAESLGTKGNERPAETLRRYLASSFFKDHLQTYKKRPIYWLFSSGKQGAFQALVYLHRYHEGTLARMRAEYVVPLTGKMQSRIEMLEKDKDAASSTAARNKIAKQIESLKKKHVELLAYDEKLRHYADMRISLDLDDGVKVNYGKFGDLLAEVKAVTGGAADD
jgi:hypothetical protein